MKNWKAIATASGLEIPDADLERIAPSLDALENSFRHLPERLPLDLEPAVIFRAAEELE